MPDTRRQNNSPDENITFFNGFLRHPQQVGSVIPSSRFLKKHLIDAADISSAMTILELGPGTGGTTRAFLKAMQPDARLLAIEINREFVNILNQIQDPRLMVYHGNAINLNEIIIGHLLPPPDVVISGIPFSTMSEYYGQAIINSIFEVLAEDGRFVAYQFRDRVEQLGCRVFGPAHIELELFNIPPIRIYRWQKTGGRLMESQSG